MHAAQKSLELLKISHGFSPYFNDVDWISLDSDIRWLLVYTFDSFDSCINDFSDASAWIAKKSTLPMDRLKKLNAIDFQHLSYLSLSLSLKEGAQFLDGINPKLVRYYYAALLVSKTPVNISVLSRERNSTESCIVDALSDPFLFHLALHNNYNDLVGMYIEQCRLKQKSLTDEHLATLLLERNEHDINDWLNKDFWKRWVSQSKASGDVCLFRSVHEKLNQTSKSEYIAALVEKPSEFSMLSLLEQARNKYWRDISFENLSRHADLELWRDTSLLDAWVDLLKSSDRLSELGFDNPCWKLLKTISNDNRVFQVIESLGIQGQSWDSIVGQMYAIKRGIDASMDTAPSLLF